MRQNIFLLPIVVGGIFFVLAVLLFTFIDSPFPLFAGLFVAFLVFEITFFYRFVKNKSEKRIQ